MTPDDFSAMLTATVPKARIAGSVAEVELVVKDPDFVDKIFFPMVNVARDVH